MGVKEEKISEIERSFIKNAKSKYPEIDEKTVIDYANKIAKYDKEDRKVEHVAEAVNYASSNPKTHFDIGEFSIKRAIDGKHTGHPQAERVIDIGIGGELGKKAKEVNDKFKNIQYKTKNLSNEGKQMLKVASEKLELDLDKLNKMINELQGNKPEDVAEVINRVGFASGEPMPKKTKELPIGKQSDKEFLSGKWQYGGSRKDIVDRWTNESLDKIGEGKQFKTKEDAIKEIRKMAKTRKEIDRHEEARILNIVADRIDKLEKPSKPSVKKQAEKHEDDLPF